MEAQAFFYCVQCEDEYLLPIDANACTVCGSTEIEIEENATLEAMSAADEG